MKEVKPVLDFGTYKVVQEPKDSSLILVCDLNSVFRFWIGKYQIHEESSIRPQLNNSGSLYVFGKSFDCLKCKKWRHCFTQ